MLPLNGYSPHTEGLRVGELQHPSRRRTAFTIGLVVVKWMFVRMKGFLPLARR
jgi:hypothetical protein